MISTAGTLVYSNKSLSKSAGSIFESVSILESARIVSKTSRDGGRRALIALAVLVASATSLVYLGSGYYLEISSGSAFSTKLAKRSR